MRFGYLLVISKSDKFQYETMAYLAAASIKKTQKAGFDDVTVVTDSREHFDFLKNNIVFDNVIFDDRFAHWDGRSHMMELSPYARTVCIDVDFLFLRDTSHWIEHFINDSYGLYIPRKVFNFKGDVITNDYFRKSYKPNNLPTLYSGYTYFDKTTSVANEFFKMVDKINSYQLEFRNVFLNKHIPEQMGTDEIFSLAAKILGIEDHISYDLEFPRIVHLKSQIQDSDISNVDRDLGYYFDDTNNLTLGSFRQFDIVHYSEKDIDYNRVRINYEKMMLQGLKHV